MIQSSTRYRKNTMISTYEVMNLAKRHLNSAINKSSAIICYEDAMCCYDKGDVQHARERAIKSLQHSVGIFHKDCRLAMEV